MDFVIIICSSLIFLMGAFISFKMKNPWVTKLNYNVSKSILDFFINVCGIGGFIIITGVLEKQLMQKEKISQLFTLCFSRILSLFLCCAYMICNKRMRLFFHPAPIVPVAILNIVSIISQILAFQTIQFPSFAASKPLRIVLVSVILRYPLKRWYIIFGLLCSHFIYFYEYNRSGDSISWIGIFWLVVFCLSDSVTGIWQEKIFQKYKIKPITMMYYTNMFTIGILLPHIIYEEPIIKHIEHILLDSSIMPLLIGISIFGFLSQFFTIRMIYQFGSLVLFTSNSSRALFYIMMFRMILQDIISIMEYIEFVIIILLICTIVILEKGWLNRALNRKRHFQLLTPQKNTVSL